MRITEELAHLQAIGEAWPDTIATTSSQNGKALREIAILPNYNLGVNFPITCESERQGALNAMRY